MVDIEDYRRLQLALERSKHDFISLAEASPDSIIRYDRVGRILYLNTKLARDLEVDPDQVIGKHSAEIWPDGRFNPIVQTIEQAMEKGSPRIIEFWATINTPAARYHQIHCVPDRDIDGQIVGAFAFGYDQTELKKNEMHLQHMAHHDVLTGLPNRRLLTERLFEAIEQARNKGGKIAILYLDLDGFKPINDQYGHEFGDRVLVEAANRLAHSLKGADMVARIGGDEFVVLLTQLSNKEECEYVAHRLLEATSRSIVLDGINMQLSTSAGICLYPDDQLEDPDILLRYADQAMYMAKSAGRNQFVFFDAYARGQNVTQSLTIHELRQALGQNQICVYYQPILDLVSGQVIKAEALVRWQHPTQGIISPAEFIPVAENGGLIHEIGDLVFRLAAKTAYLWHSQVAEMADQQIRISVNRSPRQFFYRNELTCWRQYLDEQDIPGNLLGIEITEGLLLDDRPEVHEQINEMRAMGMTISLDDFGTGYSALSYLRKFKIDYLKIDRSFIHNIEEDTDDRAIVESIIAMAKHLSIKVIAEGVETPGQAQILQAADCELVQGYLYAKPMPEAEFLEFVSNSQMKF
jgi:diguanylate cyclase (GGDEF)-like protein/PAS domain S-box-containing protein